MPNVGKPSAETAGMSEADGKLAPKGITTLTFDHPGHRTATPMFDTNPEFTKLVDDVVESWGKVFYGHPELAAGIENLYQVWLADHLPASWPKHRRDAFIADQADEAAGELGPLFDDLIDTITDQHGRDYGVLIHPDDHAELLETARRNALDHYRKYAYHHLLAAIEQERENGPGRGEASMTSCGPTGRRRRPRTTAEVNIMLGRYSR